MVLVERSRVVLLGRAADANHIIILVLLAVLLENLLRAMKDFFF